MTSKDDHLGLLLAPDRQHRRLFHVRRHCQPVVTLGGDGDIGTEDSLICHDGYEPG
ncbi:hypothetical protein [Nocardia callitridis]|uniref:hypothetical protein n=1 Tax=Nocardia callitridis TaxID=648753 RepID=UPI0031E89A62